MFLNTETKINLKTSSIGVECLLRTFSHETVLWSLVRMPTLHCHGTPGHRSVDSWFSVFGLQGFGSTDIAIHFLCVCACVWGSMCGPQRTA